MTVSLEAIFLALFVLASQNRLTEEADERARLDLQIDLMAEREMTAVVRLLLAKKVVTVAEITNIVDVLDREDGKKDGNFGGAVVPES